MNSRLRLIKTSVILLLYLEHDYEITDYVKLPGYNFVFRNSEQKRGGGVGSYLKEELDFKIREDLNRLDTIVEQL